MIFLSCGFDFFSMLQIIFNLYKTITNDITVYFWLRALYYKISAIIAICFRIITAVFLLWSLNLVWTQMFYFVSIVLFLFSLYVLFVCHFFKKQFISLQNPDFVLWYVTFIIYATTKNNSQPDNQNKCLYAMLLVLAFCYHESDFVLL